MIPDSSIHQLKMFRDCVSMQEKWWKQTKVMKFVQKIWNHKTLMNLMKMNKMDLKNLKIQMRKMTIKKKINQINLKIG